jgi:fructose-specific component phosphotransferase system IIB-like protein
VRIDQRHQAKKAVVRDAQDADLAVALGDVLDEPIDGVIGVGRMIDRSLVQRAAQGTIDDVVSVVSGGPES